MPTAAEGRSLTLRSHILQQERPVRVPDERALELLPTLPVDAPEELVHGADEAVCMVDLDELLSDGVAVETGADVAQEVLVLGDVVEGGVLAWGLDLCDAKEGACQRISASSR